MLRKNWKTAAFTLAGLGFMAPAQGDQITDMQAQIDALRSELSQVKSSQGDNWLNERRAEEVKGLIMEVLSDADTRASLLNDGALAGHNGKHFFIASADGAFLLEIGGQIDFRYIYNNQDDSSMSNNDDDEGGFQTRRLKLKFDGHVSSPKIGYHVQLAHDRTDGNTFLEEYHVSHRINDNLEIAGGKMKLPFLREELVSSSRQLAVERSTTNEFFTLNRAEGVRLTYGDDNWVVNFMVSDGANSEDSDFNNDQSELALTIRGDIALEGDLDQGKDFTGWSGEGQSLILGGALHYETGDGKNGGLADYSGYTADVSYENSGFNLFGAYIMAEVDPDASGADDREMNGIVLQGGLHVVPDKVEVFLRWEYIDGDLPGEDEFDAWTAGVNYYINGHQTKFTADVVYLNEMLPTANPFGASIGTGLGLIDGKEDEMAIRTQFQLLF